MNIYVGTIRVQIGLLAKLEFPPGTPNGSRLKSFETTKDPLFFLAFLKGGGGGGGGGGRGQHHHHLNDFSLFFNFYEKASS